MFKINPKILAHKSVVETGNYVTPEFILNKGNESINLFRRYCPHRMYPLHKTGDIVQNIFCNFHAFEWSKNGEPINNNKSIGCGKADIGKSGLIIKDFQEPDEKWVNDLASETNLVYSHATTGESKGSWLWMMEIQADLLHIRKGAIHPDLSEVTNLDEIKMSSGDGWILQTCSTGWWLFVFPYTFIEWSPGCLSVNYTTPHDPKNEFGFKWVTQFYYDPLITDDKKTNFETLEDVFLEDVAAIEQQNGPYFPLLKTENRLEKHCVTFGEWFLKNKK